MLKIYTDGCCLNNQKKENKGGWAFIAIFPNGEEIEKKDGKINTTNQRMELTACIEGMLLAIGLGEEEVKIFSDSAYVCNCVKDGWYLKWIRNNWLNSKKEPVKNQDLWKIFIDLLQCQYFEFIHIPAHSGIIYNEKVDNLAKIAAKAATGRDNISE